MAQRTTQQAVRLIVATGCLTLAAAAQAQTAASAPGTASAASAANTAASSPRSGVAESTDAAKAAAVEKAAAAIRAQRARDAKQGLLPPAIGPVHGETPGGLAFLSGGITSGDRVAMHAERARYSLWVVTVAKGSGAYLADAWLRVVALKDKSTVLEGKMDGPWFLVALPPGRYEVAATLQPDGATKPQTLTQQITVPKSGQRQAVLRFDSTAQVAPEMKSSFNGNPFAASAPKK